MGIATFLLRDAKDLLFIKALICSNQEGHGFSRAEDMLELHVEAMRPPVIN